jgi:outer membrane protein assembly factor BamB
MKMDANPSSSRLQVSASARPTASAWTRWIEMCVVTSVTAMAVAALIWYRRHPQLRLISESPFVTLFQLGVIAFLLRSVVLVLLRKRDRVGRAVRVGAAVFGLAYAAAISARFWQIREWHSEVATRNLVLQAQRRRAAADAADSIVRARYESLGVVNVTAALRGRHSTGECTPAARDEGNDGACLSFSDDSDEPQRLAGRGTLQEGGAKSLLPPRRWQQYRGDSARSGICCAGSPAYRWSTQTGEQFRSSPTVSGALVFVGAHATGKIFALSRASGQIVWDSRAPNWIHNEVLVADGLVIAGFGNSERSEDFGIAGSPPSGVVAFRASTGMRVWTYETRGAVMTSPVIYRDIVAFVTSAGEAFGLSLATGKLLWHSHLRGYPIMGSPALSDTTMYAVGEPGNVCALSVRTGQPIWCVDIPGSITMLGHASPTVSDSILLVTAVRDTSVVDLFLHGRFRAGLSDAIGEIRHNVPHRGPQVLVALRRRDGAVLWEIPLGAGHKPYGHTAGTAAISGNTAVVVSPIGQTVTAVDLRSGQTSWQVRNPSPLRGPPTILGSHVIVISADGSARTLDLSSGVVQCQQSLGGGVDRAGPTIAGSTAYVATLTGAVMAVPARALGCAE